MTRQGKEQRFLIFDTMLRNSKERLDRIGDIA